jgi:hypothetical protein
MATVRFDPNRRQTRDYGLKCPLSAMSVYQGRPEVLGAPSEQRECSMGSAGTSAT